ncbi:MAG: type II toxin-antitoxin system VapC family toxin [Chloroflexota bacterium]
MKIVDVNVLLYAVNRDSEQHESARAWLDAALARPEPVGFAWSAVLAFLRISTHPALFARPLTTEASIATMRSWLSQPSATVIDPTSRHLDVLAGLLASAGTAGNLVNDAHLAALAVENAAELISFDSDFERFAGLEWSRPPVQG